MIAHTLGNPFDLGAVSEFAKKHDLFLVEDCCDALGATYNGKKVGTFGVLGTLSFYPAHHITMGEGGAVLCNRMIFKRIVEVDSRLGPRLLLRTGQGQHLQTPLRLEAWRSALRL